MDELKGWKTDAFCVSKAEKSRTNEIRGTGNTLETNSCDIDEVKNGIS
jgi:hypothetical protein